LRFFPEKQFPKKKQFNFLTAGDRAGGVAHIQFRGFAVAVDRDTVVTAYWALRALRDFEAKTGGETTILLAEMKV
jgi:hypothetical protein